MSGEACIEYLQSHSRLPDVILLDVTMPGMTGYEVCTSLRNIYNFSPSKLPIIMMSARTHEVESVVEALECGWCTP